MAPSPQGHKLYLFVVLPPGQPSRIADGSPMGPKGAKRNSRPFHRYAGQNQFRHHVGVTYVAVEEGRIIGFATVTPATLDADDLPAGRKLPPYPLPVLRVARLAVSKVDRGRGVCRALLRFCIELAETMRDELGCVGLLVDAKTEAIDFYKDLGFVSLESEEGELALVPRPRIMFLPLAGVPRG